MRKFTILALLAFGLLAIPKANAQTPIMVKTDGVMLIPDHSTEGGEPSFYSSEYKNEKAMGDDNAYSFSVYDLDFNLLKEATIQLLSVNKHYYIQRREYIYKAEPSDLDEWGYDITEKNLPIETFFTRYFATVTNGKIVTLPNGTKVVAYEFFEEEKYGETYPRLYYMLMEDGYYHQFCQSYREVNLGRYGEYEKEIQEYEYSREMDFTYVHDIPDNGTEGEWFGVTKGIFGKGLHYITPILKEINYSEERDTEKEWGTMDVIIGFEVHSIDGEIVSTINLPSGYFQSTYDNELHFSNPNGRRYLMIDCNPIEGATSNMVTYSGNTQYCSIYSLNSESKMIPLKSVRASRVAPRTPRKGENVTVSLNDAVQAEGCVVNVVASDGRTMLQKSVPAGENTFTFNTAGFPQGLYVVTTAGKQGKAEAAKIIVR